MLFNPQETLTTIIYTRPPFKLPLSLKMAALNARLVTGSRRGSKSLLIDGFKYLLNKSTETTRYWRCATTGCRSTVSTNCFDTDLPNPVVFIKKHPADHTHVPDEAVNTLDKFKEQCRMRVTDNPSASAHEAYSHVLATHHQGPDDLQPIPTFRYVSATLQRSKNVNLPPIPATLQDINIPNSWANTWRGDRFLLEKYVDPQRPGWGFLIYATDQDLAIISNAEENFMDASFRSCPPPFAQYFTIHGTYKRKVLVLASVFMTRKYNYILKLLRK